MRPETELAAWSGRDDAEALETLYLRHGPQALGIALRVLREPADAEEVLQECFLEVWQRAREYTQTRGTVEAWLLTIAKTRAIDRLRARDVRQKTADGKGAEPPSLVPNPEALSVDAQDAERVRIAVAALPDAQRLVLELVYWAGLSQTEIADRTGAPLGTVKTRVRLALRKLAEVL